MKHFSTYEEEIDLINRQLESTKRNYQFWLNEYEKLLQEKADLIERYQNGEFEVKLVRNDRDYMRAQIVNENLMQYIDQIDLPDQNKAVIREYVAGDSQKSIAQKYNIHPSAVNHILKSYIKRAKNQT